MKTVTLRSHGFVTYPMLKTQDEMFRRTELMATWIRENVKGKTPLYLCRGSSGLAVATALKLQAGVGYIIYIRKDGESSHHSGSVVTELELMYNADEHVIIFVDDMIASGGTFKECVDTLSGKYSAISRIDIVFLAYDTSSWESSNGKSILSARKMKQPSYYIHFE